MEKVYIDNGFNDLFVEKHLHDWFSTLENIEITKDVEKADIIVTGCIRLESFVIFTKAKILAINYPPEGKEDVLRAARVFNTRVFAHETEKEDVMFFFQETYAFNRNITLKKYLEAR